MDDFIKRKFIDYVKTLSVYVKEGRKFNQFLDEIDVYFDIDEKEDVHKWTKRTFLKNLDLVSKILEKNLYGKTKERSFLIVKELYGLTELEYEILLFTYILDIYNDLSKYFFESLENFRWTFALYYLNCTFADFLEADTSLIQKGIKHKVIYKYHNDQLLNNTLFDILKTNDYSKKRIKTKLLGVPLKPTLKLKDYPHISTEAGIVKNILINAIKTKAKGVNIMLYGGVGTGKTEFAKLIAKECGLYIYAVKTEKNDEEATRIDKLSDLASKQGLLSLSGNNCILFDEAEDAMNRGFSFFSIRSASKGHLNRLLEETQVPVIWTTNNIEDVDPAFLRRMTYSIEFKKLTETQRLNIWKQVVRKNKFKIDSQKLIDLNKNYDVPASIIANAVNTTKMISGSQDDFETFIKTSATLVNKKRTQKKSKEFEADKYSNELVNADLDVMKLVENIKNTGNLNFSLCLYGEPGTGKSHYAKYLANELGLKVVFKRASDLKSKWVGETEQNIAKAFQEAKDEGAMLIFDEADSFLQNRQNANASWEVSQVNEMLTWMEAHEYPFVCTTNLMSSLDEASLRRFTFKIKFDFLTPEQVNKGIEHFFGIKNANCNIKGLTAGDFATVKKKAEFLGVNDLKSLCSMLNDEAKIKQSETLKNSIGF